VKFSIVMPTYNRANYISAAIESIIHQTTSDWELFVVDDASTDDTEQIVKKLADERITYIKLPTNRGVAYARNVGYRQAKGKYIVIADSDDINLPARLEKMNEYMEENPLIDIAVSNVQVINEHNDLGNVLEFTKSNTELRAWWLFQPKLPSFMIFRRQQLIDKKMLYHNENYKAAVDYEWYSNLDDDVKIGVVQEVLYLYRRHHNQISTDGYNVQQKYADMIREKILNQFGIFPTENEKKLHSCISQCKFSLFNKQVFQECLIWAEKISNSNQRLKVIDEHILNKVLLEQLLAVIESEGFFQEELLNMLQQGFLGPYVNYFNPLFNRANLMDFLERVSDKPLFIYGSKLTGYLIGKEVIKLGFNLNGYVDGNSSIWGKHILGKQITGPDRISNIENSYFVISVLSNAKESILQMLVESYKISKDQIIFTSQLIN